MPNMEFNCGTSESINMKSLICSVNANCKEVEDLALKTICEQHIPFLNPLRILTKGDFWTVLNKYDKYFDVVEKAVLLSALTDFVTCGCENGDLFDYFHKKKDKNYVSPLLLRLQTQWNKFFRKLKGRDLTVLQLTSLMKLLKQSVGRLTNRDHKLCFDTALARGENALMTVKTKVQRLKKQQHETNTPLAQKHKPVLITPMKHETKVFSTEQQKQTSVHVIHVTEECAHVEKQSNNLKENKNTEESSHVKPYELKKTNAGNRKPVNKAKPQAKKYSSDIMKYILKPCENKLLEKNADSGRNLQNLEEMVMKKDRSIMSRDASKPQQANEFEAPTKKKPRLDEHHLTNGKVNAFQLMMKKTRKKHIKNNLPKPF